LENVTTHAGVNIVGYLEAELGLGEIARKLVLASERAGIPVATLTNRDLESRQEHRFEERGRGNALYDTNIICVNAAQLPELRRALGIGRFAGRYNIGVWFWELARFPEELHFAFDLVDEIWVASEFTREAVSAETSKPVHVAPMPLEAPPSARLRREDLSLPPGFLYFFSFDHFSVMDRKNPVGLVDAFKRAFSPGEGPTLLIRSINGDRRRQAQERLQGAAEGRPDIRVVDGYVPATERDAVFAACDCYVSLHRSEGLGLTMAEAMAVGKPVIATGYSGNLTFMNEQNSYLVRYRLTHVPEGCDPYPQGMEWADPDLDHAAELMRRVYERPDEAGRIGKRGRDDLQKRHTLDRTAEFIRERVNGIPDQERSFLAVRGPLERAAEIAQTAPGQSFESAGRRSSPVRRSRLMLVRALWPELAAQRALGTALIESLRSLERINKSQQSRLDELERIVEELKRRAR